ncbi:hypothetical protein IJT10_04480 [bacterium]|nr:hypothetical protein [bacterium]
MIFKNYIRRKFQGLTLLEVLVSINVLAVALMSFASIFPAAFRLNKNSHKQTIAAKYAAAVAEELRSRRIYGTNNQINISNPQLYLDADVDGWKVGKLDDGRTLTGKWYYYNKTSGTDGKTIDTRFGTFNSIEGIDPNFSIKKIAIRQMEKQETYNSSFFEIYVTVEFKDNVNGRMVTREATVVTGRTGNRA